MGNDFQLVPHIDQVTTLFKDCEVVNTNWNAHLCKNRDIGLLLFESNDKDFMDRTVVPIYIQDPAITAKKEAGEVVATNGNKINAFMDHDWDGFYSA